MKYINILAKHAAVFILATGFLLACNPAENDEAKSQTAQANEIDTHREHKNTSELSLNNGAKWKADSSTNKNVGDLYNRIADANPVMLDDYHKTGRVLQTDISKMITECRMQGANHDALHHWLEPLMEMNKKMSAVKSGDEGKQLFGMIRKQLEMYPEYFD